MAGRRCPSLRHGLDLDHAVGQRDRRLDRVGQALAQLAAHDQAVDDDRDVVLELLVEHDPVLERCAARRRSSRARSPRSAAPPGRLPYSPLRPRTSGASTMKRVPSAQLHHLVDDLLGGLPGDRLAADVAVRLADARPQQAQVVVDLGDRADRRARVARRRLLVDRDRRRQALDRVDVGLVHLPQELPRVGAQRLDVAALALGVDRVEGERRLARARQPRDDHERVARERERRRP